MELGPLVSRLVERDREAPVFEGLFQDAVRLKVSEVRDNRRLADTSENAPLLIRIVKYPYEQDVTSGRRRQVFEPVSMERDRLQPRPAPVTEVRALRDEPFFGNPFKALAIHPEPLAPPPGVDEWLDSVGRA